MYLVALLPPAIGPNLKTA